MPKNSWGQCGSEHSPRVVDQSPSGGGRAQWALPLKASPGPREAGTRVVWARVSQSTNPHPLDTMQAPSPVATI